MSNSTFNRLQERMGQRIASRLFVTAVLLSSSVISTFAQRNLPSIPSTPTGLPPQQFSTNLIQVRPADDTTKDGNIAVLDNSFSNTVDNSDGVKVLDPVDENFYLVRDNQNLVLESRKQVVTTDTLFYGMTNIKVSSYMLQFFPINMIKPGLTAVLVDKYLATRTPVSLSSAPSYYEFSVTADAASAAVDRFMLILIQAEEGPLPVDFISIGASKSTAGVQVSWKVAGERGIQNYSIERSANGRSFVSVGTVIATGSGYVDKDITYSFKDLANLATTQYYRIRSNGLNNEIKYSPVVKVSAGNVQQSISVLTNPVKGSIYLQMVKVPKGNYSISLTGIDGRQVLTKTIQHAGESVTYPVQLPSSVSRGTYVLSVTNPDIERQSRVLIIDQN